jgi:MFS family permease
VIVAGALIETLATVLLVVALARHNPASGLVLLTIATVFIFLMGFGIGMGWAHLVTLVLHLAPPGETDKASAAITTMQALGAAFGAALAGVIVNSTGLVHPGGVDGALTAARWLYALLALPAAVGILLALRLPAVRGTAAD